MAESQPVLGIIVALKEEQRALRAAIRALPEARRGGVRLVRGGVGGASAAKAARQLAASPGLKLLCSAGFSGALSEALPAGGVLLAERVQAHGIVHGEEKSHTIEADPEACAAARAALSDRAAPWHGGTLLSVAQVVFESAAKRRLGERSGALAVDMEAAAVARVAREKGLGFFALRTISDAVDDELPEEAGAFLNEQGQVRPGAVARFALKGPRNIKKLMGLKTRVEQAARALGEAWGAVLPALLALQR